MVCDEGLLCVFENAATRSLPDLPPPPTLTDGPAPPPLPTLLPGPPLAFGSKLEGVVVEVSHKLTEQNPRLVQYGWDGLLAIRELIALVTLLHVIVELLPSPRLVPEVVDNLPSNCALGCNRHTLRQPSIEVRVAQR